MNKLLSSNLNRLMKNKVFWLGMAAVFVISIVSMLSACRNQVTAENAALEFHYFNILPIIGVFSGSVLGLFLGTEYSDGTMRNKIIIGHTRLNVYLSSMIMSVVVSTLITLVCYVGGLVGIPTFGIWSLPFSQIFIYMLIGVLSSAAMAAIFVAIAMNCSNKAVTSVVMILLALLLMVAASVIYNLLNEPKMVSEMFLVNGQVKTGEPHLNPKYIDGTPRSMLVFLLEFLPTGQAILLANMEMAKPYICLIYSIILIVIVTAVGFIAYRKKDLK